MERCDGLKPFRCLGEHVLIALDGTQYFTSAKVHCPQCSTRRRGKDKVEYYHTVLSAAVVAPGHTRVLPLEPEFVVPQDGHDKQDCETLAMRRWLTAQGFGLARLKPIYLGDDLFSRQPSCVAVLAVGGHFLFVAKPSSHPTLQEYLAGIELPEHGVTVKRGKQKFVHRYRWLCDVPLRQDKDALSVNWFEIEITNADGEVIYRNSFITDLPVHRDNVAELVACGRARWKIENETFNVLKTKGYNLEHSFGHGKENLSAVLVVLNLLAFAFHTVCEAAEAYWRRARDKAGTRITFFSHIRTLTTFLVFPSWQNLLETIAFARPPPLPP
jgi:hypothetical protein